MIQRISSFSMVSDEKVVEVCLYCFSMKLEKQVMASLKVYFFDSYLFCDDIILSLLYYYLSAPDMIGIVIDFSYCGGGLKSAPAVAVIVIAQESLDPIS
jgi:hypothetical protein